MLAVDADIAAFVHGGVAIVAATRDDDLRPEITRGWGPELSPERCDLRICLSAAPGSRTISNLERNGAFAATFTLPTTYRSIQIKGEVRELGEPTAADLVRRRGAPCRVRRRGRAGRRTACDRQPFRRAPVRRRHRRDRASCTTRRPAPARVRRCDLAGSARVDPPLPAGSDPVAVRHLRRGRHAQHHVHVDRALRRLRARGPLAPVLQQVARPTSRRTSTRRCGSSIPARSRSSRSTCSTCTPRQRGPVFEAMKANLEAIASAGRVTPSSACAASTSIGRSRCAPAKRSDERAHAGARAGRRRPPRRVHAPPRPCHGVRRRGSLRPRGARRPVRLLAVDPPRRPMGSATRLFAIADNGYPSAGAGGEVPFGVGVVGISAERRQVVCVPNLARSRIMERASRSDSGGGERQARCPLPGLPGAQSVAAIPLLARDRMLGVLYLESPAAGCFGPHNERTAARRRRAISLPSWAASTTGASRTTTSRRSPRRAARRPSRARECAAVTYYQADDSVFVDEAYVIKGVPGRILWRHPVRARGARARDVHEPRAAPRRASRPARRQRQPGGEAAGAAQAPRRGGCRNHASTASDAGGCSSGSTVPVRLTEVPTSGPMRVAHDPDRAR